MRTEPLYTIRFFYPDGWEVLQTGKKGMRKITFISPRENAGAVFPVSSKAPIIRADVPTKHL